MFSIRQNYFKHSDFFLAYPLYDFITPIPPTQEPGSTLTMLLVICQTEKYGILKFWHVSSTYPPKKSLI